MLEPQARYVMFLLKDERIVHDVRFYAEEDAEAKMKADEAWWKSEATYSRLPHSVVKMPARTVLATVRGEGLLPPSILYERALKWSAWRVRRIPGRRPNAELRAEIQQAIQDAYEAGAHGEVRP